MFVCLLAWQQRRENVSGSPIPPEPLLNPLLPGMQLSLAVAKPAWTPQLGPRLRRAPQRPDASPVTAWRRRRRRSVSPPDPPAGSDSTAHGPLLGLPKHPARRSPPGPLVTDAQVTPGQASPSAGSRVTRRCAGPTPPRNWRRDRGRSPARGGGGAGRGTSPTASPIPPPEVRDPRPRGGEAPGTFSGQLPLSRPGPRGQSWVLELPRVQSGSPESALGGGGEGWCDPLSPPRRRSEVRA